MQPIRLPAIANLILVVYVNGKVVGAKPVGYRVWFQVPAESAIKPPNFDGGRNVR